MKNILIPVEDHAHMEATFAAARAVGAIFGSRLEGAALGPDISDLIAADFMIDGAIFDEKTRSDIVVQSRVHFEQSMRDCGVPPAEAPGLCYAWRGDEIAYPAGIGRYGRLFDLIVVGRPGAKRDDPRPSALEGVLFESGRPILIAPHRRFQVFGETIVIAWNQSSETARAIAFAMPLLRRAKRIVILTVAGAMAPGPSGAELVKALLRHGLPVELREVGNGSNSPGRVILEEAEALGADLLVKGGYTQSRLRQMIFGGATRDILAHAQIPVFMAH